MRTITLEEFWDLCGSKESDPLKLDEHTYYQVFKSDWIVGYKCETSHIVVKEMESNKYFRICISRSESHCDGYDSEDPEIPVEVELVEKIIFEWVRKK